MLIQIPHPKPFIHQGPTVQPTDPIPDVSRPVPNSYVPQRPRFVVTAPIYVHQGATTQQTHPVPPVTRQEPARLVARTVSPSAQPSSTQARTYLHQGATIQATFPVPKTEQWERAWWWRTTGAYVAGVPAELPINGVEGTVPQTYEFKVTTNYPLPWTPRLRDPNLMNCMDGPAAQFDGATAQPWFLYQTSQPELIRFGAREFARRLGGPAPQVQQGPTIQDWFIYPTEQAEFSWWPPLRRLTYQTGPMPQLLGLTVTIAQTYEFKVSAPELAAVLRQQALRYIVPARAQVDQGPTVQDWFLYPTNEPELIAWTALQRVRRLGGPTAQLDGQISFDPIPPVLTRPDTWFGATSAVIVDVRRMTGPRPQFDGATNQDTSPIPPVTMRADPWFGKLSAVALDVRRMTGPRAQLEGATVQATFPIPGVTQRPDSSFGPWRAVLDGRLLVGPRPQIHQGPTVQPWFLYPTGQPDIRAFLWDGRRFLTVSQAGTWPLVFFQFIYMRATDPLLLAPTADAPILLMPAATDPFVQLAQSDDPFGEPTS